MLTDRFERVINYLRVSVTDRCNFRCVYCMPVEGIPPRSHAEILTFEEITEIVRAGVGFGIRFVRLTGGEPMVRKDLVKLVRSLSAIPGLEEISLTTNAVLLEHLAYPLKEAGLKRVNVSLDTLDPEKFARITRGGSLDTVWRGIQAAEAAGLQPIKINTVVVRGINDAELIDLARLTLDHPWQVRFIEFMPVGNGQDWGPGFPAAKHRYLPVSEIREKLAALHVEETVYENGSGPARVFRIPGGAGTIGLISPVGEHFCQSCNRLRLTADGNLRSCLLHEIEIPIREPVRGG